VLLAIIRVLRSFDCPCMSWLCTWTLMSFDLLREFAFDDNLSVTNLHNGGRDE